MALEKVAKLAIFLTPNARDESLEYVQETGVLKVHVRAKPIDNEANQRLIEILAKKFEIPKSSVSIKSGHRSRTKLLEIRGLDDDAIRKALSSVTNKTKTLLSL
ncbi:MAG: DUF167 domain-containing protein [Holosporales bacterium]|nr:DUF167 domain-containing protein [Holosporales bacterium]